MGFRYSLADPDIWLRPNSTEDREEYYKYILVYIGNNLCVSHQSMKTMTYSQEKFKFKKNKISPLEIYLRGGLEQKTLNNKKV